MIRDFLNLLVLTEIQKDLMQFLLYHFTWDFFISSSD